MTLTATWLLPIALIPGTWQAFEVPATPLGDTQQFTEGQALSQPEQGETDKTISAEAQKEGGVMEGKVLNDAVPGPEASTSQDQGWGSQSSSYASKHQPPQDYWDPSPSAMWNYPDHGYPNPMYSSSSSFHYAQSHYPPGAYFTPMPGYGAPMYGYYQPVIPEQTSETYEPTAYEHTAPPPIVVQTVPLPSSRPNTPPRRRR